MPAFSRSTVLLSLLGLAAVAGLVVVAVAVWQPVDEADREPVAALSIGITTAESSLLVRVADAEGFFADAGLDVTVVPYDLGRHATEAMFDGTLDLATTSQFAAAGFGADQENLRILASIDEAVTTFIVARRDAGIASARDLVGRPVGVPLGTSVEFFLVHFLLANGLSPDAVEWVDLGPAALKEALYAGTVDAATTWQPHFSQVMERLGDNAFVVSRGHQLPYYMLLVTTQEWLADNGEAAERLMRALIDAETFLTEDQSRARDFVSERLGHDPDIIDADAGRFRLELGQGMLTTMEDQASWMAESGRIEAVPNYLPLIDDAPMTAARPESVTLFR